MVLLNKIMRIRKRTTKYTDKVLRKSYRKGTSLHQHYKKRKSSAVHNSNMVRLSFQNNFLIKKENVHSIEEG